MGMRGLFMMASSFTVLGLLLAGCAPAATPTSTPLARQPAKSAPGETVTSKPAIPTPTSKPAEQQKYGGVVTRVLSRDPGSLDVQREVGADASLTLFNVYQGLVRLHPIKHQEIVSELAESWEASLDGRSYTFKFPKGIQWHDGKPFTTDDVKYSLERMQNPEAFKTISPRGKGLLAAMDKAEIVDESTIKIDLKYPSASFLLNIATGWIAIEPKHLLVAKGDMRRDLVGTGAFKLKEFNPDISLELTKNTNYFVKGLPYLDGIKFFTIKDAATRFSALRTGQVKVTFDGTGALSAVETEIVKKEAADKIAVYEHDAQTRYSINFNMQRKPWEDVRVRRAVDLVFDRQAAIRVHGKGYLGGVYVTPWGMKPADVEKLPGYRQPKDADVAEAKRLMAEAGLAGGFKTTLLVRAERSNERQGVLTKDQLAKIGIDTEIVLVEQAVLNERLERRAFDLVSYNWLDNTGDPDETLNTYYVTGGSRNYGNFRDPAIDDLIKKQSSTLEKGARKVIVADLEKEIMAQVPMVVVFWDVFQVGAWREVKDYSPGPGIHPWGKLDQVWLQK